MDSFFEVKGHCEEPRLHTSWGSESRVWGYEAGGQILCWDEKNFSGISSKQLRGEVTQAGTGWLLDAEYNGWTWP